MVESAARSSEQPFSEESKIVLMLADEEARRCNHNYKGTEHILLGLVKSGKVDELLSKFDIDPKKIRSAIEFIIARGAREVEGEIGFTPRARKVLELSEKEMRDQGAGQIAPGHILVGLIKEGEGIAAGVLESHHLRLDKVQSAVREKEQLDRPQLISSRLEEILKDPTIDSRVKNRLLDGVSALIDLAGGQYRNPQ